RRQEKCCTKSTLAAAAKVEGPLVFACDLAHDGKTEPGARPAFVEPAAALHRLARLLRVKSGAVVLNTHLDPGPPAGIGAFGGRSGGGARHGDPDAGYAKAGGIFQKIAHRLLDILLLHGQHKAGIDGEMEGPFR